MTTTTVATVTTARTMAAMVVSVDGGIGDGTVTVVMSRLVDRYVVGVRGVAGEAGGTVASTIVATTIALSAQTMRRPVTVEEQTIAPTVMADGRTTAACVIDMVVDPATCTSQWRSTTSTTSTTTMATTTTASTA